MRCEEYQDPKPTGARTHELLTRQIYMNPHSRVPHEPPTRKYMLC